MKFSGLSVCLSVCLCVSQNSDARKLEVEKDRNIAAAAAAAVNPGHLLDLRSSPDWSTHLDFW